MQAQEQIHKEPEWHHWTLDRMEDNLGLMEDHADQYLIKPYQCDCFLKHTSKLAGYSSEMLSFSKSDKEKKYFQTLQEEFRKMHSFFEKNLMPEKVDMERIRDRTRLIRKEIVDIEDKSNPHLKKENQSVGSNPTNPGKYVLECKHGKCECVIHKVIAPMSKCNSSGNPGNPENHQDLLGRTGSMAELHDLLVERGFYYSSREGTPDTKEGQHQVGYILVYKNRKGDIVRMKLIEKGQPSRKVHKVISPMMTKVREAGTADIYQITNVVTME